MKKVNVFAILIIILLSFCLIGCTPEVDDEELPKLTNGTKAIVILPGIMGPSVYNEESGEQLWDPFVSDARGKYYMDFETVIQDELSKNLLGLLRIVNDIYGKTENNILEQLSSDEDGNIKYPSVTGYNPDFNNPSEEVEISERRQYGALYMYEAVVRELRERYGDEYEVVLFNYNFFDSNINSAEKLEDFIEERNYTEMIVVAHSMGGHIASQYFTKKENRARVDKYISIAVPYFGSMVALDLMEDPYCFQFILDEIREEAVEMGLGDVLKSVLNDLDSIYSDVIVNLLTTTSTIYQLLPSQESMNLDNSILTIDGEPFNGNLFDFYKERKFGIKSDGNVRACLENLENYYSSFYVNKNDGSRIFSADLIDSYYIAGDGFATTYSINYTQTDYSVEDTLRGDGTVSVQSATRGLPVDGKRVFLVSQMHAMGNTFDGECRDVVFNILDQE